MQLAVFVAEKSTTHTAKVDMFKNALNRKFVIREVRKRRIECSSTWPTELANSSTTQMILSAVTTRPGYKVKELSSMNLAINGTIF
jgi:hypothetical protein